MQSLLQALRAHGITGQRISIRQVARSLGLPSSFTVQQLIRVLSTPPSMHESKVVVAGSEDNFSFAVVDFSTPGSSMVVSVNPGFGAGCRVAIDGNRVAVGSVLTGSVRLVDIRSPASPELQGVIDTHLSGIGAIAIHGTRVVVAEFVNSFQARLKLIEFSSPMSPLIIGTAPTPFTNVTIPTDDQPIPSAAIASVAFLSDDVVFASGPSAGIVVQVDFSNSASPAVTTFNPGMGDAVSIDVDSQANRLAAGANNSTILKLFDAVTKVLLGTAHTTLRSVTSVALKSPLALVGSPNDFNAARVDFSATPPGVSSFDPNLGGPCTTALEGRIGVCGAVLGSQVKLFDLTPTVPMLLATANTELNSISTLAISIFGGI